MFLDYASAIGLAAALLDFAEFSIGIVSKSREIQNSVSGSSQRVVDLSLIQSSIASRTSKIQSRTHPGGIGPARDHAEDTLLLLSNQCLAIAQELETTLSKVRLSKPKTVWRSVRSALKEVWKKEKIEELKNRLYELRNEVSNQILVDLQAQVNINGLQQSEGFAALEQDVQDLIDMLTRIHLEASQHAQGDVTCIRADIETNSRATLGATDDANNAATAALEQASDRLQTDVAESSRRALAAIDALQNFQ